MKRSISTRLIYILVSCGFLMPGCLHQVVKSEQTAATQSPEKKTVETPPAVQPDQKKAESLGVVGGQGAQKAEGQPASKSKYQARKEKVAQFKADYEKSADKLAFLLANLDSPDDRILVEVAGLLGRFDDPKSIEALKKLENHSAREDASWSVAQTAGSSLQWLAAAPDMQKLHPDMSAKELEKLIVKYRNNDVAEGHIYTALRQEVTNNPGKNVPLLIEYYAHTRLAVELAKQYPDIADKGLEKCLAGTSADNVGYCMVLIGKIGRGKYMEQINEIAFFNKGNVDYKNKHDSARIRDQAEFAYSYYGAKALPYLEKILYSQYDMAKSGVISTMVSRADEYGAMETKEILNKYYSYITKRPETKQAELDEVLGAIKRIEGKTK